MIVVAFSLRSQAWVSNGLVALLALVVVCIAGDVWPGGDWSVPDLALFFLAGGQALAAILRAKPTRVKA